MKWFVLIFIVTVSCSSYNEESTSPVPSNTASVNSKVNHGSESSEDIDMEFANMPQEPTVFSVDEEKYLLGLARSALDGSALPGKPNNPVLNENLGAFVTLKKDDNLRGCIGFIIGQGPLWREIPILAKKAAYEDPRFMPVRTDEVPDLHIEISVMTKLWPMASPEEIKVGTHGLFIILGNCSGILLPQVATEFGVDRYGFLDMVCQKAGLQSGAWKEPRARIFLFAATVFGED